MNRITVISPKDPICNQENHSDLPHILLVIDQIPKVLGGGERIALRIAELLPQYGYRASIITYSAYLDSITLKSPPCPIYLLPLKCTYDITALLGAFDLSYFICRHRIELVQTFFESSDLWAGFVTKTMSSAKLIWSRRDMGILRSCKHRLAYRMMACFPDAVFAVSEHVRQYCIDVDRIDSCRVHTIYNGLNLSDWNTTFSSPKVSGGAHITSVGNVRRVKGYDILIKAAALVVAYFPNASFSIAGDVLELDYYYELQALIRDLNLNDRFHFVGGITNIIHHLCTADIFVLPSRSEGFSNALVEAMAASLPVIASNVGGNAEAIIDGVNGLLIPPDDPNALFAAIIRLLSDPTQAKAMGSAGNAFAAEFFTTDAMMKSIVNIYDKLLVVK